MKTLAVLGLAIGLLGAVLLLVNPIAPELAFTMVSVGGLMTIWFKLGALETEIKRAISDLAKLSDRLEKQNTRLNDLRVAFEAECMRIRRLEEIAQRIEEHSQRKRRTA